MTFNGKIIIILYMLYIFTVIIAVMLGSSSSLKPEKHYEELLTKFSEAVKKIFQTTTKLFGLPVNMCQKYNLKVWRDFKESVDISLSLGKYCL